MSISILIPTLNEENYIGLLLEDLTKQTFKDFEVVVVDGRSVDATKEVVLKFQDPLDLTLLVSPKTGPGIQRNYGAKHAKYGNLLFLDADVRLEVDFLEKLQNRFLQEQFDAATCWIVPTRATLTYKILYRMMVFVFYDLLSRFFPTALGACIFVRKSAFDEIHGFDEEVFVWEDSDFFARLNKKGWKLAYLKDPYIYYSTRRLEKEGLWYVFFRGLKMTFYYLRQGPIKDSTLFKYEFGNFKK